MNLLLAGTDTETTGLDFEKGHRIMEVAMIIYDFNPVTGDYIRKGAFNQRINPQRSVDPGAQAVHGISFDDVCECPIWEEVAPKIVKIMQATKVIVAHNGDGFDMPFIASELIRAKLPVPNVKTVDTMLQCRWATFSGKYPSLEELCFATETDYDKTKAHAALYDVERMMECFFKAYKAGFIKLPEL